MSLRLNNLSAKNDMLPIGIRILIPGLTLSITPVRLYIKITKLYKQLTFSWPYLYLPKFTVMHITTTVEVKCECRIPFHSELVGYLEQELASPVTENAPLPDVPHEETIRQAIQNKMLFIKIIHPLRKLKPKMLERLKKLFKKDFVGTIRVGKDETTLILI